MAANSCSLASWHQVALQEIRLQLIASTERSAKQRLILQLLHGNYFRHITVALVGRECLFETWPVMILSFGWGAAFGRRCQPSRLSSAAILGLQGAATHTSYELSFAVGIETVAASTCLRHGFRPDGGCFSLLHYKMENTLRLRMNCGCRSKNYRRNGNLQERRLEHYILLFFFCHLFYGLTQVFYLF